ncbi:MAG TPA: serine hydrolase domain-containing protein [Gemmatimonadales bacterium]|nr:serine hydrolase domain-containing protein [Gemmatimonadales bacterium]
MRRLMLGALMLAGSTLAAQDPFNAAVDSIARDVLRQTGVPSASLAIVRDGKVVYVQAYGDAKVEGHVPATTTMRYSIGSISKQFCAGAILLLVQDGKLSLDDPVSKYFPDLTRANEVTIRELLSHTSGYQDYWPQDYVMPNMLDSTTARQIVDRWARIPLDFDPGTRWQYSNTNYVIAGMIVEKVSGMPFFDFLRSRILNPLGIESVKNIDLGRLPDSDPTGYVRYALGPARVAPKEGKGWLFAAGELAMTPSDLAKWDLAMMNESLLSPASYHTMETEVLRKDGVGTGYGLGVDVGIQNGHRAISHNGEVSGFTAENLVFPDDRAAIVVLTNQDAAQAGGAIARQVSARLFTTEDASAHAHESQTQTIFEGLQKGTIDRSLFTTDANFYFNAQTLADFASSLSPLGAPAAVVQVGRSLRGGMVLRVYQVRFTSGRAVRAWTFEMPDGKLEQYQVASN